MTSYWTQTTSYGDIKIIWEYEETSAEEKKIIYLFNE